MSKIWARIHATSVKNDEDAQILHDICVKYSAHFNTHDPDSMWYDFEELEQAGKWLVAVISSIPYLEITVGKAI